MAQRNHSISFFTQDSGKVQKVNCHINYNNEILSAANERQLLESLPSALHSTLDKLNQCCDSPWSLVPDAINSQQDMFLRDIIDVLDDCIQNKDQRISNDLVKLINQNPAVFEQYEQDVFVSDTKMSKAFEAIINEYKKTTNEPIHTRKKFYTEVLGNVLYTMIIEAKNIFINEYQSEKHDSNRLVNKLSIAAISGNAIVAMSLFAAHIANIVGAAMELPELLVMDVYMLVRLSFDLLLRTLSYTIYIGTLGALYIPFAEELNAIVTRQLDKLSNVFYDRSEFGSGGESYYQSRLKVWNHVFTTCVNTISGSSSHLVLTHQQNKRPSNRGKSSLNFQMKNVRMLQYVLEGKPSPSLIRPDNIVPTNEISNFTVEYHEEKLGTFNIFFDSGNIYIVTHTFFDVEEQPPEETSIFTRLRRAFSSSKPPEDVRLSHYIENIQEELNKVLRINDNRTIHSINMSHEHNQTITNKLNRLCTPGFGQHYEITYGSPRKIQDDRPVYNTVHHWNNPIGEFNKTIEFEQVPKKAVDDNNIKQSLAFRKEVLRSSISTLNRLQLDTCSRVSNLRIKAKR